MGVESKSPLDSPKEARSWKIWKNKAPTRYLSIFPPFINIDNVKVDVALAWERAFPSAKPRTDEHVMADRVTRTDRRRYIIGIAAAGILSVLGIKVVRPLLRRGVEKVRFSDDLEKGEISWSYLLRGGETAGDEVRKVVELYSPGLSYKENLGDYSSWANTTEFGFYVKGLHLYVDDLRTDKGRERLADLVGNYEGKMDLKGAREEINAVDAYARGGDLTLEELGNYFKTKLSFSEDQWDVLEKVYRIEETKDSSILQDMISQSAVEIADVLGLDREVVTEAADRVDDAIELMQRFGAEKIFDFDIAAASAQTIPQDYTHPELLTAAREIVPQSSVLQPPISEMDPVLNFALIVAVLCRSPKLRTWARGKIGELQQALLRRRLDV